MGSAPDLAEITNAAAFVLGQEVAAFFVDAEGGGVGAGARDTLLLFLFFVGLFGEGVCRFC